MNPKILLAALLAAAFSMASALAGKALAAPDNTLGMALMSATVVGATSPSILRGSGAVSVSRPASNGTGYADVVFDRDISDCTCTASVGHYLTGNNYAPGNYVAIANCPYAAHTVRVTTSDNGVPANFSFQLIVFCPK